MRSGLTGHPEREDRQRQIRIVHFPIAIQISESAQAARHTVIENRGCQIGIVHLVRAISVATEQSKPKRTEEAEADRCAGGREGLPL